MKLSTEQLKELRALCNDSTAWASVLDELIALRELKGDQVPVAQVVISKNWPDVGRKVIDYYLDKIQHLPVGTELFTAPQKLVVLPGKKALNPNDPSPIWCASKEWNSAIDACRAAIEAAGGIVKEGE